jgi:uncharacterized protein YukE
MSDDYRVDADAMTAVAGGLADAAEQVRGAAEVLGDCWDDGFGPGGLAEAVGELTGVWQGRLHAVYTDVASAAAQVRSARDAYLDADSSAAGELNRGGYIGG